MTANPTLLSMPLAQNGQKNVIPTTQATAGDGLFSQSTGFPAETSLPLGAGGVAPSREDFNGLANLLGGVAYYAQKGWQFQFDAGQDYFAGCIVRDPTDGKLYECLNDVAAGGSVPSADSVNWKESGVDPSMFANPDLSNLTATGEAKLEDTTESVVYEDGFAIIYPNGGTEAIPANISSSSRYVESNPFSGYYVYCEAEIYVDSYWMSAGYCTWAAGGGMFSTFASAKQYIYNGDSIVIQTGNQGICYRVSVYSGTPDGAITGIVSTCPCRVKVWKLGKIPA